MIKFLWYIILVFVALVLQVTLFPAYLVDPFSPNLLIIFVVYMGLRESVGWGVVAFLLGLVQDSFSGLYLGLNGLSYLIIFLFFSLMADRLYTDRRSLMILGVFTASLASALLILLLLFVFAESRGIYASLIQSMVPQGLVNAFAASLLFTFTPLARMGEPK